MRRRTRVDHEVCALKIAQILVIVALILSMTLTIQASEQEAHAISNNIQKFHTPYGTVIDPIFASPHPDSPEYTRIVGYTRAADSAIWTGHYLAAEAFRYQVTRSPDALQNARRTLDSIASLLAITGTDLLARCIVPVNSPYAAAILQEEGGHGIYKGTLHGQEYYWIGRTSRDQYSGVFFGLGVAYDMLDDESIRSQIRHVLTKMLDFLLRNNWNVIMPHGRISTTFIGRPEQMLSFLQVGRHVNPAKYNLLYQVYRALLAVTVIIPMQFESFDDHYQYFRFNLDYINFYNLIRLENDSSAYRWAYFNAYSKLRRTTRSHGNAHFNMIDRGLRGADEVRDAETRDLLDQWLTRPRRDVYVDLRGAYSICGFDKACRPLPIAERVKTDFIWQRSPFLLFGGGSGTIETAGIDYILPYWMARYYGVIN